MIRRTTPVLVLAAAAVLAQAQHLWWKTAKNHASYSALYGEIRVLATNQTIYFCGCNWWPGSPAGGYTGIQDTGNDHRVIFSVWDTSPTLHPSIVRQADQGNRFGGEGEGAHTHTIYAWQVNEIYRFFVTKSPEKDGKNTLVKTFFFDQRQHKWVLEAAIDSPNDGGKSVPTFDGAMAAFLENWSGRERDKPKLALYRLWAGSSPTDLTPVTQATGDGKWGTLNNAFFLAEGDDDALKTVFARYQKSPPRFGEPKGHADALSIPSSKVPEHVVAELEELTN